MSSFARRGDRVLFWTLAAVLLLSVLPCGVRPLWEPDEGRYAECAREMLASGDFLVPRLRGTPHLTKPPLTYWALAGSMALFGTTTFGARLPGALAFALTVCCVVGLARRVSRSRVAGLLSGLVFATSALPFAAGHLVTTDVFVTAFETLGLLSAVALVEGTPRAALWRHVLWGAFGLAFLTKGPPGLVVLAGIVLFAALRRHRVFFAPLPILAFLLLSSSWYLWIVRSGVTDFDTLFAEFGRHVGGGDKKATDPIWTQTLNLAWGSFPWVLGWPVVAATARAHWRRSVASWSDAVALLAAVFLFGWLAFTLASSRQPLYVVPLFVPIAVLTGSAVVVRFRARPPAGAARRRLLRLAACAWLLLLLAFEVYPPTAPKSHTYEPLARTIRAWDERPDLLLRARKAPFTLEFYLGLELERYRGSAEAFDDAILERLRRGRGVVVIWDPERHRKWAAKSHMDLRERERARWRDLIATRFSPPPAGTSSG